MESGEAAAVEILIEVMDGEGRMEESLSLLTKVPMESEGAE